MRWMTSRAEVADVPFAFAGADASPPVDPNQRNAIVPFSVWRARASDVAWAGFVVGGDVAIEIVGAAIAGARVIAVNIPKFTDGRAYSVAFALRQRYGFAGELVATGDVQRDQLQALARVGFDAFVLPAHADTRVWAEGLRAFSVFYQTSADGVRPTFSLRERAASAS